MYIDLSSHLGAPSPVFERTSQVWIEKSPLKKWNQIWNISSESFEPLAAEEAELRRPWQKGSERGSSCVFPSSLWPRRSPQRWPGSSAPATSTGWVQREAERPDSRAGATARRGKKQQALRERRVQAKTASLELRINWFSAPEGLNQIGGGPGSHLFPFLPSIALPLLWEQPRSLWLWEKVAVRLSPWEADAQGSRLTQLPKPWANPFRAPKSDPQNLSGSHPPTGKPAPSRPLRCPDQRAGTKLCLALGGTGFPPTSEDLSAGPPHQPTTSCELPAIFWHPQPWERPFYTDLCTAGKWYWLLLGNKKTPRPPARAEPRRLRKAEEETTSSELPSAAFDLHRRLSHPRAGGWGPTYGFGFFSNTKFKAQVLVLLSPFPRKDFTSQKPRDRFVFSRILSLCWLRPI